MPHFPHSEQLTLPALFARYVPGKLHPDGNRYLPLLIFALEDGFELGIVDRHHVVAPEQAGSKGIIRIVSSLSTIALQPPEDRRHGFAREEQAHERVVTAPAMYGQVVAIPRWEEDREHLAYEYLYTELLIDIGLGTVGVRTAMTAADLAAALGKPRLEVADRIRVSPSRIDVLAFVPEQRVSAERSAYETA